jgi:hypothetical protein
MTTFSDIETALDSNLNDMVLLPDVAWPNAVYTPTIGTMYLRPTFLPGDTDPAAIGSTAQDVTSGLYQIDIYAESGRGQIEILEMADRIADQFKRGSVLTYNGVNVRVVRTSRGGATVRDGWFVLPVTITFNTYTDART